MIIQLTRSNLNSVVCNMAMAISPKPVMPVMSTILFCVEDGKLSLTATDGEVYINSVVEVLSIEGDAIKFCIEASRIKNALANIPEQPIRLEVSENEVVCKYKGGKFKLPLNPEEPECYPVFPSTGEVGMSTQVDATTFCRFMAKAVQFTSTDELRPVMCGVCVKFSTECMDIVGTNGHSLVKYVLPFKSDTTSIVIFSRKTVNILSKMFQKGMDKLAIWTTKTNIFVKCGGSKVVERMIEGRYPNYNAVIPTETKVSATFEVEDMVSAIKRVSVMGGENCSVKIDVSSSCISLDCVDLDFNTAAHEEVSAECTGKLMIGCKPDYLQNTLSLLTGTATMEMTDKSRPCMFREMNAGYEVIGIVMPVLV